MSGRSRKAGLNASVVAACVLLVGLPASWAATPISRVSLIFACHLDVGFHVGNSQPGFDSNVLSRYFNDHLPNAARLAEQLRQRNGTERFVWLSHSWVVSLFLDCPTHIGLQCPNATTVALVESAIRRGDIIWHALPHNAQVEMYDADLLQYGVRSTHELDRRFGFPHKITASQRDVPGLTRAAVPLLAYQGVKAISVGVNGGSAPPAVPHNRPFWWRDPLSGAQLLAFWHPGGYSGCPVDTRAECVQADGLDHALCMSWWGDNAGPPTEEQVLDVFLRVHSSFPHASVQAAGFDAFVYDLAKAAPTLDLPVVTEEVGDTWIYGVASDPAKVSEYRALLRMRRASAERYDDPAFKRFSRLLLKLPEHTWGVDAKEYPNNWDIWSNADLHKKLAELTPDDPFSTAIHSWRRQRAYNRWAVEELGNTSAAEAGWRALAALEVGKAPPRPAAANSGFQRVDLASGPLLFDAPGWSVQLCPKTGAIVGLWAGSRSSSGGAGASGDGQAAGASAGAGGEGSSGSGGAAPNTRDGSLGSLLAPLFGGILSKVRLPSSLFPSAARAVRGEQRARRQGGLGASLASFDAPLALPVYSTYSEEDYNAIWDEYAYMGRPRSASDWFYRDFGKPGATTRGGARRADYLPRAQEVWWRRDGEGGLTLVVKAAFDWEAVDKAGAPKAVWTEIRAPAGSPELSVDVTWQDKGPTRLPEAFWLRWVPRVEAVDPSSWRLYKLGQPISPLEVVANGSQAMHAVGDEGVSVDSADGATRLHIRSLDAAIVSPGHPKPLPVLRTKPDLTQGMAFCLANNLWGTNYPSWFPYQAGDENMRFRFVLQLEDLPPPTSTA